MRQILFHCICCYLCVTAFTACESQLVDLDATHATTTTVNRVDDSKVIVDEDAPPSFPGGDEALLDFLDKNVGYPKDYEGCASGRVIVSFTVDVDGSIIEPKVEKSICIELDREALRVVGLMPKWVPAKENGKNIKAFQTIPVIFKLR